MKNLIVVSVLVFCGLFCGDVKAQFPGSPLTKAYIDSGKVDSVDTLSWNIIGTRLPEKCMGERSEFQLEEFTVNGIKYFRIKQDTIYTPQYLFQ